MTARIVAGIIAAASVLGIAYAALGGSAEDPAVAAGGQELDAIGSAPIPNSEAAGEQAASEPEDDTPAADPLGPVPDNFGEAATLVDIDAWLQTDATSLEDFDGQVKILQFWTFSCFNCKNTIPTLRDLYANYHEDGLEIIGVHAPEFDYEKDQELVLDAAEDLGVTWPIAIDNQKLNFRSWQGSRRFWPRTYVIDANGDIRFDHIGEGAYEELEETVAYLLANGGA